MTSRASSPSPAAAPSGAPLLRSFWMTGYEGADHRNRHDTRLDMQAASGHVAHLTEDHRAAAALGLRTVRESIGWRLAEPRPGRYVFSRATRIAESAAASGLQVLWSCMHYGTPEDVNLLDDGFVDRYAAYAEALAEWLKRCHVGPEPPIVNPINEIGYLAWVVSETDAMQPYRGGHGASSAASGFEVKRRLVRAALAGMAAMRRVLPTLRVLHVEPLVHVVAPAGRPELAPLAERIASYQWQVWDMLAGRLEPGLGGNAEALDLIGINCYHSGQWEAGTEKRLAWHLRDPRRKRFSLQLQEVHARYGRPMLVAETGHIGSGRADWLNDIAGELRAARATGVPLEGCCLYPAVDRPDWDDASHWHHSGLWDVDPNPPHARRLHRELAAALAHWQAVLPRPASSSHFTDSDRSRPSSTMPTLIVFSHLRWGFVYQRPQHILSRLARTHRVLFVEEPVFGGAHCSARFETGTPAPGVTVLTPHTPIEAAGFHDDQLAALRPLLAETLRAEGITDYIAWFYTPMALPLIAELTPPTAVVYDCMDELTAFKDAPRQLRQRETALLKIAGVVFTGGPALYAAKRGLHANLHCLPSAVDAAHYAPESLDRDGEEALAAARLQADIPAPRLGYFGVIDERLDLALLAALADARPEWQLVMAGPVAKIATEALPQRPNIHWLGMQPYERLPHLVAAWHVCLMPFALNESTRFISPTKTLEYMAAEKPVVSTAVPDVVALYGDVVNVAHDRAGFIDACEAMLAECGPLRGARIAAMQSTVARLTWDATAATVAHMLDELLRRQPATSPAALRELAGLSGNAATHAANAADPVQRARMRRGAATATHAVEHLVIGAGPTGLACAYQLGLDAPEATTLVVEREARVGGYCRSSSVAGFTFDQAGHIMFSSDPEVLALYDTLLGDNLHWQDREAWIYSKGVHTRYPFQGALHGLPPAVLKDCLIGAIEARYGPIDGRPAAVAANEQPRNFEEFIHRVWGAGIARHFAIPYNRKLWAVPLAEMETSWLGNRVPLPDLAQMIEGALEPVPKPMGPNARFGYPLKGGFQALMDAFLPHLGCELALQTRVTHVSPSRRSVRLDDGRTLRYGSLVSSMPLPQLVQACGDEAPAEVRAAAQALRHVSVRCVNLGIGREALTDKHWIYYPEDTVFHRIFVQGNASPHCNPPGGFGLTCEITYAPGKPLPCDGQALVDRVIADCKRVGMLGDDDVVLCAEQVDMPCAYVVYDHARAANVQRIRDWLAGFDIVLAGRYAEWEYYNSDHAFVAGRKAARRSIANLARQGAAAAAPAKVANDSQAQAV